MKASDPELYNESAWFYDFGQKYGLWLLGGLGRCAYQELARRIVAAGGIGAGARVLDAGCGTGYLFRALAEVLGSSGFIAGVDFSEGQLKRARAKARRIEGPRIQLELGRIEEVSALFPRDSFDAAYCAAVLPVLVDPVKALSEMLQVTKPGGRLAVWTISHEALRHARFRFYWNWAIREFDLKYYSQPELTDLFVAAGCEAPSFELIGLNLIIRAAKPLP